MPRHAQLGLVLFAAVLASAQENSAPLSETKQQLQTLKKDQAASRQESKDSGLATDFARAASLPDLGTTPSVLPQKSPRDDAKADAKKRNWLLDGYDKLGRKPGARAGAASARADGKSAGSAADDELGSDGETAALDPKDPDYFLRVYERQRAEAQARREQQQQTADATTDANSNRAHDAFAPFMQGWLAGSPVRDVLKDSIGGSGPSSRTTNTSADTATRASGAGPEFGTQLSASPTGALSTSGPSTTPRETAGNNPFIQALGLGLSAGSTEQGRAAITAVAPPVVVEPPPRTTELTTPELPKIEPLRRPPNPAEENKKYFPQLKKF